MSAAHPKWPLGRRVEIEWRDSCSQGGWKTVKEHQALRDVGPLRSIGYVLTQDKDVIQLAQSQSAMTGHVTDTITIPRENIVRLRKLKGGCR